MEEDGSVRGGRGGAMLCSQQQRNDEAERQERSMAILVLVLSDVCC